MRRRRLLTFIGGILAVLVGILRGIGGLTLVGSPQSAMHLGIGLGLLIVSAWLLIAGLGYIIRRDNQWRLWLIVGLILFWID